MQEHLHQAAAEDEKLQRGRHADSPRKNVVVGLLNALKKRVVNVDQHTERRPRVRGDQRQQCVPRFVIVFGTFCFGIEQRVLIRQKCTPFRDKRIEVGNRNRMARQVFDGQIDAATLEILANVAQDIRQLESDAGLLGKLLGTRVGVAEDADADQSHDGRDEIAVAIEMLKGRICIVLARLRGAVEVHRRTLDKLIEELAWYLKTRLRIG